ncbi:MAG: hypothetical protein IH846_11105 [Acidobacteria bacterium]|nr:hypothetical protein [Acidobacteriota bacterium]
MLRRIHLRPRVGVAALMCLVVAIAAWVLFAGQAKRLEWTAASEAALRKPTGYPQLISVEPFPGMDGQMCQWVPANAMTSLRTALQQERRAAQTAAQATPPGFPSAAQQTEVQERSPLRIIRDPYPAFSSVAVDTVHDEVIFTDENLFQILVYDRMDNTPPTATMTEPKRVISGLQTKIEFNCDLYIDPKTGDIYTIAHDSGGMPLTIFSRQAKGDVPPTREIDTPKGTYGIAVDEEAEEIFLAIQHDSAVVVYEKYAARDDPPIRLLQGDKTMLGDAHGIALDTKNKLMFVSNYGSSSSRAPLPQREGEAWETGQERERKPNWPLQRSQAIPGTGRILPPSINVYPIKAQGDVPPLRIIQGPKTQMNMPSHLFMDEERGELYLANDMDNSILVFDSSASGDVAPKRVLKGPQTLIQNPTGVFVDIKNDELWVASFGKHVATVFQRTAEGDTPPLRVIRNGPLDAPGLMIGNPGAIGYDTKREEILVPN